MDLHRDALRPFQRLIEEWEGYRAEVYEDMVGVPTVGFGFTPETPHIDFEDLPRPLPIEKGRRLLRRLARQHYFPQIRSMTRLVTEPNQLAALASLAWNIGLPAYKGSTLLELWNEGQTDKAEREFLAWVYAGGERVEGLVRRRRAERRLCERDERVPPPPELDPMPVADGYIERADPPETVRT
jgi:lysozyme